MDEHQSLSGERLESMLIRWRLSQQFGPMLEKSAFPEADALRYFLESDVPRLFAELMHLRPELGAWKWPPWLQEAH